MRLQGGWGESPGMVCVARFARDFLARMKKKKKGSMISAFSTEGYGGKGQTKMFPVSFAIF
jgi:hypothetical protein